MAISKYIERSTTLPSMAAVMMSNNNINTKPETQVLPNPKPEKPKKSKNPIKFWILKVKAPEETVRLPLVQTDDSIPKFTRQAIRSNYMDKSIEAKKKVIRMLFVVVAEFFVCWAPIHVLNTWYLFSPEMVYRYIGSTGVSLVHLLSYISSCCNPITYCFMNHKFRMAFISLFQTRLCRTCIGKSHNTLDPKLDIVVGQGNSDLSGNDSTIYVGRASRSEVVVLERDERV
ncbi:cholecystokinin receptor type A [Halyomorpha halys]|uniref:cholecystokinin receptor type A n=1 Tax=Halyomorpha halys TaxID=286706 RepID=UPI0034D3831E